MGEFDVARRRARAPRRARRWCCRSRSPTTSTSTPACTTPRTSASSCGRARNRSLANWRHLPVSYTGRAGTVVVSGTPIVRPHGSALARRRVGAAATGRARASTSSSRWRRSSVPAARWAARSPPTRSRDHVVGLALLNDWSARDIQAYEYQPLGPHLGKSFATSLSPWIVTLDALEPFRVPSPRQDPRAGGAPAGGRAVGPTRSSWRCCSSRRRCGEAGCDPHVVSRTGFADLYWTLAQQLAHLTTNGASTRPGDLYASGTVSGPGPRQRGQPDRAHPQRRRAARAADGRGAAVPGGRRSGDPARMVPGRRAAGRVRRGRRARSRPPEEEVVERCPTTARR